MAKKAAKTSKRKSASREEEGFETIEPNKDDPTLGTPLHPSDTAKVGEATTEELLGEEDADGRTTAREGLRPMGREIAHPTAAPRVGKTSGETPGTARTIDLTPPEREDSKTLRVEATRLGYYDNIRRRTGDVFDLADESEFSRNWMRPVDRSVRVRTTTSQQDLARQQEDLKALRGDRRTSPLGE